MRSLAALLPLFLSVWVGCAYRASDLPTPGPDKLRARVDGGGFLIGVLPYHTPERSERVLGEDVTEQFWPVYVAVLNQSPGVAMIDIGRCRLVSADGEVSFAASAGEMFHEHEIDEGGTAAGATLAGGLVMGLAAADGASDANRAMLADWNDKELTRYVVDGGETKRGLLYFRANRGKAPFTVEIAVERRERRESFTFRVPLEADG